jgi:hypothetical protein
MPESGRGSFRERGIFSVDPSTMISPAAAKQPGGLNQLRQEDSNLHPLLNRQVDYLLSDAERRQLTYALQHPGCCEAAGVRAKHPAGVEPARSPWQGDRLPLHHGRAAQRAVDEKERVEKYGSTLYFILSTFCCGTSHKWGQRDLNPRLPN